MVAVPPEPVVTIPVAEPTMAMLVLPLLHTPPGVASYSVSSSDAQVGFSPMIALGAGLIVTVVLVTQPDRLVYVILATPVVTPVTTPVEPTTLAIYVCALYHLPPVLASCKVVVVPGHACVVPVIAGGSAITLTESETKQPAGMVYVMAVLPAAMPVITPDVDMTVPMAGVLLVQVPPAGKLAYVVVLPIHTLSVPTIGVGDAIAVSIAVI